MKIARNTLAELVKIVTGDTKMSPYRSGPMLVRLFNEFGWNDFYGPGFPSRWKYTEERLLPLNGKPELRQLVDAVFDVREWIGKDFKLEIAATHLNKFHTGPIRGRPNGFRLGLRRDFVVHLGT
jgi:hypothetical protein